MKLLRVLAVVLIGSAAWAQVSTPPPCRGAVTDREIFLVGGGRIKFHLKFHTESGVFDAHSVVKLHRQGAPDASCNEGDVLEGTFSGHGERGQLDAQELGIHGAATGHARPARGRRTAGSSAFGGSRR